MAVHYQDARITCDEDGITIQTYYFPFGDKRIHYRDLRGVWQFDMGTGISGGRWRIWGSGDLKHWFPFDPGRPKKRYAFVLDKGKGLRVVLTPDDPSTFEQKLRDRGVDVRPATEPYRD